MILHRKQLFFTFIFLAIAVTLFSPMVYGFEIKEKWIFIPNSEITLIWEHTCIKNLESGNVDRARKNKRVIDWQRANKKGFNDVLEALEPTKEKLAEAQTAKAEYGDRWKCEPPPAKIELVRLLLGADPQNNTPTATSFVTNDRQSLHISADIRNLAPCDGCRLKWTVTIPKYDLQHSVTNSSHSFNYNISLPLAPQGDRGTDLSPSLQIELLEGYSASDMLQIDVAQSELDILRQEYIDTQKRKVPARGEFVIGWRRRSKHFSCDEFNSSRSTKGEEYRWILCTILDNLERVQSAARVPKMTINSGYRNPLRQIQIGSAPESRHLYGDAADMSLVDFDGNGKITMDDWLLVSKAAKQSGACVEPFRLTPTWIHMDWRGACPSGW